MSGLVASVRAAVAPEAVDSRIDRDGCRSDLLRRAIRLRNEIRQPLLFQCGDSLEPLFSDENPAAYSRSGNRVSGRNDLPLTARSRRDSARPTDGRDRRDAEFRTRRDLLSGIPAHRR